MKTKQLQETDKNKEIKSSSKNEVHPYQESTLFIPTTKVTLNWWAMGLFAFSFFSLGAYWALNSNNHSTQLTKLTDTQEQILAVLAQTKYKSEGAADQTITIKEDPRIIKRTGDLLRQILTEKGLSQNEVLVEKQIEIEDLKNQIRLMAEIRPSLKRAPAAIKKKSMTIPYNKKNASVLWYEQKLEKESYLKRFQEERENFLAQNDLKNPLIKNKFNELKKYHRLTLHELEAEHNSERISFAKNKYRVIK